jgi:hypothetical protein
MGSRPRAADARPPSRAQAATLILALRLRSRGLGGRSSARARHPLGRGGAARLAGPWSRGRGGRGCGRRRDEGGELGQEALWRQRQPGRAVPRPLHPVEQSAILPAGEAVQDERRAQDVAACRSQGRASRSGSDRRCSSQPARELAGRRERSVRRPVKPWSFPRPECDSRMTLSKSGRAGSGSPCARPSRSVPRIRSEARSGASSVMACDRAQQ